MPSAPTKRLSETNERHCQRSTTRRQLRRRRKWWCLTVTHLTVNGDSYRHPTSEYKYSTIHKISQVFLAKNVHLFSHKKTASLSHFLLYSHRVPLCKIILVALGEMFASRVVVYPPKSQKVFRQIQIHMSVACRTPTFPRIPSRAS